MAAASAPHLANSAHTDEASTLCRPRVKSFVAQELRNMLTQERQRFLWGLYNTVDVSPAGYRG